MRRIVFALVILAVLTLGGMIIQSVAKAAGQLQLHPRPVNQATATPTASPKPATVTPSPATPTPIALLAVSSEITDTAILSGTIIANRTTVTATFFLEGQLYTIRRLRALGIRLPRSTAVLTLYNCEASNSQTSSQEACFWDPYLVRRDGFYEIVNGATAGRPVSLLLREANPPPLDQVWVQNRTGADQELLYGDQIYRLPAGSVQEIQLQEKVQPVFFLSNCLVLNTRSACEWLPQMVKGGIYYALVQISIPGGLPGSRIETLELQPILTSTSTHLAVNPPPVTVQASTEEATPMPERPSQLLCRLQVPLLNVRSGPGMQYLIVSRLQRAPGTERVIAVTGRDPSGEWLALDAQVVVGGWISASRELVRCDGDVASLPIAKVIDGRLAPTPAPPKSSGKPVTEQPTPQPTGPAPAPDKALLIVTNAYDRDITFTLSPEVWILKPGQSLNLELPPGRVTFTASIPFFSGNGELVLKAGDVRQLWLHFAPKEPESQELELRF
ncbi:MAG: hypothetical protein RML36_07640 [Anaerolineae bacterium]|nr:hypothetical protein [Anaerolineae bacterium]MDW8099338.1 hypothetical protein [Anaerolineae bacterium]